MRNNMIRRAIAVMLIAVMCTCNFTQYVLADSIQDATLPGQEVVRQRIIKANTPTAAKCAKKCFVAGTQIAVEGGTKSIEDIQIGDWVYAYDVESGEQKLQEVLDIYQNEVNELAQVVVGEEEILTTLNHGFYVVEKGWIEAQYLEPGDRVQLYSGEEAEVSLVRKIELAVPIAVYNFNVNDFHNYYVGEGKVLVHNRCSEIPDKIMKELKKYNLDKKAEQARSNGMAKSRQGSNGIISLTNNEIQKKRGKVYTYKLKITGAGDHLRVYGYVADDGKIIFDWITKGKKI